MQDRLLRRSIIIPDKVRRFPFYILIITIGGLWLTVPRAWGEHVQKSSTEQACDLLRHRIEATGVPGHMSVGEEPICSAETLPEFYRERMYLPVWMTDEGVRSEANSLIETIRNAALEGLNPGDYHLAEIEELLGELPHSATMREKLDPGCLADLDLLLTDAFITFCSHIISGRVNPVTITPVWQPRVQEVDLGELLRSALDERKIEDALKSLLPSMDAYKKLRDYLNRYRKISMNGGWPAVPDGPKMGICANRREVIRNTSFSRRSSCSSSNAYWRR